MKHSSLKYRNQRAEERKIWKKKLQAVYSYELKREEIAYRILKSEEIIDPPSKYRNGEAEKRENKKI